MNKPVFAIPLAGILVTSMLAQESFAGNSKCDGECVASTFGTLGDSRVIVEKELNDQ